MGAAPCSQWADRGGLGSRPFGGMAGAARPDPCSCSLQCRNVASGDAGARRTSLFANIQVGRRWVRFHGLTGREDATFPPTGNGVLPAARTRLPGPGPSWWHVGPRSGVQAALAAGPGPVRAVASRGGTGGPHQPVVPGVSAVTDAGFWKGSAGWQRRARGVGSECQGRSSDRGSPPGGRSSSRETPTATTGRCARTTPGRRTTPTWSSRCRCPRTC